MQQLYFIKKGKLEWREVPKPKIENGREVIVRPFAVAKCDLDDAFLFDNVSLKIKIGNALGMVDPYYSKHFGNLLKGPFPFGHECVAQVVEAGSKVKNFNIGDIVSVPFQISCGDCIQCQLGYTSVCETVAPVTTYGFGKYPNLGGAMSDYIKVPYADSMLLKIPENIDPVQLASLSDNIPDAYRHLKEIANSPGKSVLIISNKAKSVAQYAIILARAIGVERLDFVDKSQERLEQAISLGADNVFNSFQQIKRKYDLVIDAGSTKTSLEMAFRFVREYGTVSSSGIYIKKTPVSLIKMYAKGINFRTGFANARTDAEEVLNLIKSKNIDFGQVTSKLDSWENSVEAFLSDTTKVVVTRGLLAI